MDRKALGEHEEQEARLAPSKKEYEINGSRRLSNNTEQKIQWLRDTTVLTIEIVGTVITSAIHLLLDFSSKKSDAKSYQKKY